MRRSAPRDIAIHDREPAVSKMRDDVIDGLSRTPKVLPSQYLYDERGAELFEGICSTEDYYPTRTEISILSRHMEDISSRVGPGALVIEPAGLLLDEPLAGIDPIAVNEIRDLIAHLKDRGIGVLITDHNVRETLGIVDRAYILHEGVVLMEGNPEEIVEHKDVRRVYLGERFSL